MVAPSTMCHQPSAISHRPSATSRTQTGTLDEGASRKRSEQMNSTVNVSDVERWASAIGGAALTVFGIKQLKDRSPAGAVLAAAGGALIYRGATGHCPMYAAAGISTASEHDRNGMRAALSGSGGVNVEEVITVDASPEQLYLFWRNFEQLPSFMDHLVVVTQVDALRSRWVAKAPMGRTVEW